MICSHVTLISLLMIAVFFEYSGAFSMTRMHYIQAAKQYQQQQKFWKQSHPRQSLALSMGVEEMTSSDWDFIDAVYLITTDIGGDRFESTKSELERVQLWDKVKVRTFKADNEDRVRGCYTSHMAVLKEIKKTLGRQPDFTALVLEDNLEVTGGMDSSVLQSTASFLQNQPGWDVFHLAYMMYVPGLNFERQSNKNVVRMIAGPESSVGTSSYLISKDGVEKMLAKDKAQGFVEAIPTVMAEIFPTTRYASFPMIFHRAGKIGSLVNPQLDDFRKFMFNPALYRNWERLMVTTGLQNNQLFPGLVITLLTIIGATIYKIIMNAFFAPTDTTAVAGVENTFTSSAELLIALFPLAIALWGASLFKPGNQGAGFAKSTRQRSDQQPQLRSFCFFITSQKSFELMPREERSRNNQRGRTPLTKSITRTILSNRLRLWT